ncbi:MAG: STAS domain-containing protein [Candidatus Acidiferrales bacterium]
MQPDTSEIPILDLKLRTYAWEDAHVVECTGRLTAEHSMLLKTEVKSLLPHKKRIILDLTSLAHMDSAGLGTIVSVYISAKSTNCDLQLVNLNQHLRQLFAMTNLLSLFEPCGRAGTRML